ncbi:hypothetical protein [Chryseobacterium sp. ERMR1:04]|uniref:hypothetical protein n=1 Tax=Chryseobacterium sp. ERMR1:04 TaxID=1705393 RepID=UPI0006C8D700|nr:hypothetical protein [Chryseobacterium sp. ERMR1:04]KPH14999.1 hypothetical protein AMQ68_06210 [Chryseobacterium sp. ERMR1:04]
MDKLSFLSSSKSPDFGASLKEIILFTSSKSGDFPQQTFDSMNFDKETSDNFFTSLSITAN